MTKRLRIAPQARAAALLLALAALLICCATAPVHGKGQLDVVKHVDGEGAALEVVTYVDGAAKIGLLGIIQGDTRVSFAGSAKVWTDVVALCKKATAKEGASWEVAGTLTEKEGKKPCKLTVESGPSLRLTIVDPEKGQVVFVVPNAQVDAVVEALDKVESFLGE